MGLGEIHGAGPGAFDHLGQIDRLLLLGAVHQQRRDGALGQARIHAERQVRRGDEFLHDGVEDGGKPLSAIFLRRGKPHPAAGGIGLVGLPEVLRRGHRSVRIAGAALLIAGEVQRREDLFAKLGALREDRLHRVGRRIGKAGQVVVTLNREHVVQEEHDVFDGGLVDRHSDSPRSDTGIEASSKEAHRPSR
jgi:hypothetical protein